MKGRVLYLNKKLKFKGRVGRPVKERNVIKQPSMTHTNQRVTFYGTMPVPRNLPQIVN